jgi:hypothetical protein
MAELGETYDKQYIADDYLSTAIWANAPSTVAFGFA